MISNNPFRKDPSLNVQRSVEDWGKTKFRPTKLQKDGKNRFKTQSVQTGNNRNFNNRKGKHFYKNESCKFNEGARNTKPENATPWVKFKSEIVSNLRDEKQSALQANIESIEGKVVLKQREINYRKSIIEQSKCEPIQWEDFGEEDVGLRDMKNADNDCKPYANKQNINRRMHFNKKRKARENNMDTPSRSNSDNFERKEFISKKLLENFDSKKLDYKQNDKLRAVITKTTMMAKCDSLEKVVKDLKKKKKKFN